MWTITKQRFLEPPDWVNEELLNFGVNDWGEPYFRVVWGMSPVRRISKIHGGYEDQCGNCPSWWLQRWIPPDKWGSPRLFRAVMGDPTNSQTLFPYPEFGEYESVKDLGNKPIDYALFQSTIPFLQHFLSLTDVQVKAYKERQKELENRAQVEEITDRLMDSLPTRYGPVSYSRGGCRTSLLDRKAHEIQKLWDRYDANAVKRLQKGFAQGRPGEN
jgi:hypothetical protein